MVVEVVEDSYKPICKRTMVEGISKGGGGGGGAPTTCSAPGW